MLLFLKLIFLINVLVSEAIPDKPGKCNKRTKGKQMVIKDREGEAKLLLCDQNGQTFRWKMIDGNSYGNIFDPAIDCSDVVDNLPEAITGVYWIKSNKGPRKVWCDMEIDGGGFMLIGVQNSSVSWDVPSNTKLVHPLDSRQWSSLFGNMLIQDFRVQISTSQIFSSTKADCCDVTRWTWDGGNNKDVHHLDDNLIHFNETSHAPSGYIGLVRYYRFNSRRKLTQLLMFDKGGCSRHHPGIGDIHFIKDLRNKKIVTTQFRCSRFGAHFHKNLGWGKMNECLGTPCKSGFAFLKFTTTGSFSFSVISSQSGILNNSTGFIGCDHGECCACYGPTSDKDYCAPKCQSINGGTVLNDKNKIHVWFWVRTSLPKRVWKKCMEYEKAVQGGKFVKWHVDEEGGVPRKGPCSYPGDVRINDGVVVVSNNETLQKLPNIEGLLSYRTDNRKLYLRGKQHWKAMVNEERVQEEVQALKKKLDVSKNEISYLSDRLLKVEEENKVYASCKNVLEKIGSTAKHGSYKIKIPEIPGHANVYCHMTSLHGCTGGGWTLVMKVNGRKETFHYSSSYWSNKQAYSLGGGTTGFDDQETKLPTYWSTPFKEICLGMKVNNELNFISLPYQASSLFSVLADGKYRSTNIGRSKWLSLVRGSGLQRNCNREGFNVHITGLSSYPPRVRIGILGNQQNHCGSPDSFFGFGGQSKSKRSYCSMPKYTNTCGNSAYCRAGGNVEIQAMGYIFVR